MNADYLGTTYVVPADKTNYYSPISHGGVPNRPRALVLHTPEEPADEWESTPNYFAQPNRQASTHYYADSDGDWYQLVPEMCAAIANGLKGRPLPAWADPNTSLNWQTLSVEIEGYAASIHQTMPRGGPQWNAVVKWVADRCHKHAIPLDRQHVMGHYQLADNRTDPGQMDIDQIVRDAQALGDEMTEADWVKLKAIVEASEKDTKDYVKAQNEQLLAFLKAALINLDADHTRLETELAKVPKA